MAYPFLILVGLVVVAVGVFFWLVNRGGDNDQPRTPRAAKTQPREKARTPAGNNKGAPPLPDPGPAGSYTAVSIIGGSCQPAWNVEGRRYLAKDAPRLPLEGCDANQCTCKYEHHQDRRENHEDRRSPGLQSELYGSTGDNKDRRTRRGRRKEDFS